MNTDTERLKVYGYIRESREEQAHHGYRPEEQKKAIQAYCERQNFEIVEYFSDWGSGANVKKRPDFVKMIELAKVRNDIKFIVFEDISRFFRNLKESLVFEEDLEKKGIYIIDTRTDYKPRDYLSDGIPDNMWLARINARIGAEQYLRTLRKNVKQGYAGKKDRGGYVGPLCYGLMWSDKYSDYVKWDEEKIPVVKEIYNLYLTGRYGLTALARHLNEKGYNTEKVVKEKYFRSDGSEASKEVSYSAPFTRDIVRSVLDNKTYIGYQNTGNHNPLLIADNQRLAPIIDEVDFNRVAEIRQMKGAKGKGKNSRQKRVYLLQGLVKSSECGNGLYGAAENSRNGDETRRYLCKGRKNGQCKCPSVRADIIENQIVRFLQEVRLKNIDQIERELREIVKISAKAIGEAKKTQEYDLKHKKELQLMEDVAKNNSDWHIKKMAADLYKKLKEEKEKEKSSGCNELTIKYYDFVELRNVLADICDSFKKLQSLAAKEGLLHIFFSEVCIATTKQDKSFSYEELQTGEYHYFEQIFMKLSPSEKADKNVLMEKYRQVMELKRLLQYFIPTLFSEILFQSDETGNETRGIACKPSGLFLLLFDNKENFNYELPLYRVCMETLPAHHSNFATSSLSAV